MGKVQEARLTAAARKKVPPGDHAGPHKSFPITDINHFHAALSLAHHAANPHAVRQRAIAIAKSKGLIPDDYKDAQESADPVTEADATVGASHGERRAALQRAMDAEHLASTDRGDDYDGYGYTGPPRVADVFDKNYTFHMGWDDAKPFLRDYKMDDNGEATLGPQSHPVFKKTVYVHPAAAAVAKESAETEHALAYIAEAGSRHSAADQQHISDAEAHLGQAKHHVEHAITHVTGLGANPGSASTYPSYGMNLLIASDDSDDDETRESDLIESAAGEVAIRESGMPMILAESSAPAKGVITMRILQPGFNTSGKRYYTKGAVAEAHTKSIFVGKKMYIDHPTPTEEAELPERSVNKIGAHITETFLEGDGSLWGKAAIVNPQLKQMIADMQEHGILGNGIGVSINAIGRYHPGKIEGKSTDIVEGFRVGKSVDFVTEPGAGGRIALMESDRDDTESVHESQGVPTVTPEQIQAIMDELKTVREANQTLLATVEESNKARAEAEARATVAVRVQTRLAEIAEAELPAFSKARVAAVMEGAINDERLEEAITREKGYMAQAAEHFKATATTGGKVTGLGGNANRITEASRDALAPEAVKEAQQDLIEAAGPLWEGGTVSFEKFAKSIGVI